MGRKTRNVATVWATPPPGEAITVHCSGQLPPAASSLRLSNPLGFLPSAGSGGGRAAGGGGGRGGGARPGLREAGAGEQPRAALRLSAGRVRAGWAFNSRHVSAGTSPSNSQSRAPGREAPGAGVRLAGGLVSRGGRCGCCGCGRRQAAAEWEQRGEGVGKGRGGGAGAGAGGRRTGGARTGTRSGEKTGGLPSRSVHKRPPGPATRVLLSEVRAQTRIKAAPRVEPGLAPLFLGASGGYPCQSLGA